MNNSSRDYLACIEGSCSVGRINCSLVTPEIDKCKVTVISDVYLIVQTFHSILDQFIRHRITAQYFPLLFLLWDHS